MKNNIKTKLKLKKKNTNKEKINNTQITLPSSAQPPPPTPSSLSSSPTACNNQCLPAQRVVREAGCGGIKSGRLRGRVEFNYEQYMRLYVICKLQDILLK